MALKLVVTTNVNGDVFELILKKSTYRIGRRRDNDLRIKETYVSGYHSELNRNGDGEFELKDCGSSNGTFLNGLRVDKPTAIKAGDFIKFGILKVAVAEHESSGPNVVSLKDRPAFAKKRNDLTASIPVDSATGKIGTTDVSADSQPVSGASSAVTEKELKEVESLLEKEEKKAGELAEKLSQQEASMASLTEELENVKAELAGKEEALAKAEEGAKGDSEKTAKERERLKDLEAEAADLRGKLEEANGKLEASSGGMEAKSAELEDLKAKLDAAKSEAANAAKAQAEVEALSAKLEESGKESAELKSELEELKKSLGEKESELQSTASSGEEASKELSEKESRIAELEKELDSLKSSFDGTKSGLESALEEAKAESEKAADAIRQRDAEKETLQAELDSLKKSLDGKESALKQSAKEAARLATLTATVASLKADLSANKKESSQTEKERARLEKQLQKATAAMEKTGSELDSLRSAVSEKEQSIAALSSDSKELEKLRAEFETSRSELEQTIETLSAGKDELSEKLSEKEKAAEALAADLAQAREALEGEKEKLASEVESLTKEREQLAADLAAREVSLSEQTSALESLQAELDEKAKEISSVSAEAEKASALSEEKEKLASRIKEDTTTALANQTLIEKLETQLRENESEAVQREQKHVAELKAGISRLQREGHAATAGREKLQAALDEMTAARKAADEKALELHETIVALQSEGESTRGLLRETEKSRAELSSRLSEQTELAANRARTIEEQKSDLADTVARAKASEEALLAKHRSELDVLNSEIRQLKEAKEKLEEDLENTRVGISEALRQSREQSGTEKAKILAEGNAKLSEIEVELSSSIRAREEIESIKNDLEDELNDREERIERLSEHIEDLELQIRDEKELGQQVRSELQTTREGLSRALSASRKHLSLPQQDFGFEKESRERVESRYAEAQEQIQKLREEAEALQERYQSEIREWETRYDQLREEKLTLATEDANLKRLRSEIESARREKQDVESELARLSEGMKTYRTQHDSIKEQKDNLVRDREELKAGLNVARSELDSIQRRCSDSRAQESKLAETIESAERRIHSLKKLEAEMEQAFERKRQKGILSRSDVFSEATSELISANSEFSKEDFYRKLISKLDLIDDLSKRYDNRWRYPKVADQLSILKGSFIDFLHDHSVREFKLEPGTVVSIEERKRIKLVPPGNANGARLPAQNGKANGKSGGSRVVETVRPGYVYQNGSKDVIIRKAEVIVA
jgi:chromosome segregation ATPase